MSSAAGIQSNDASLPAPKRAFTLIELLVVIAIIAILAAILFPVFAQAKDAAKKTQTLSNTKNLVTANILYSGDNDDRLPFTYTFPYVGTNPAACDFNFGWGQPNAFHAYMEFIEPYVKNTAKNGDFNALNDSGDKGAGIWVDPVWNFTGPAKDSRGTAKPNQNAATSPYLSYQPNSVLMPPNPWLGCSWMGKNSGGPASTTELGKPAQTILLSQGSAHYSTSNYGIQVGNFAEGGTIDGDWTDRLAQRRGMAYAFADGHAKFVQSGDAFYTEDPAYKSNKSAESGDYLPEPIGPVTASWRTRPGAQYGFGPRDGGNAN